MATSEEIGSLGSQKIDTGINYKRHSFDAKVLDDDKVTIPKTTLLEVSNVPNESVRFFGGIFFYYYKLKDTADREELSTDDLVLISAGDIESGVVPEEDIVAMGIKRRDPSTNELKTIYMFSNRVDLYAQGIVHKEDDGTEVGREVFEPASTTGAATGTSVEYYYTEWPTINPAVSPMVMEWVKNDNNSTFKVATQDLIYLVLRENLFASGIEGERTKITNEIGE